MLPRPIDGRKERYCRFCSETHTWVDKVGVWEGVRHTLRHARKVQAGRFNQGWSELFGLLLIKRVRGQSVGAQGPLGNKNRVRELREEMKRLKKKKGGSRWCSSKKLVKKERRFEEDGKMEVDKDIDKRSWINEREQLRDIARFTDVP